MEKNNWKRTVLVMIEKVTRQEVEKMHQNGRRFVMEFIISRKDREEANI